MGGVIRTEGGSFTKQSGVDAAGGPSFTRMSEANNLSPRPLNTSRLKRRLFLLFPSIYKSSNVEKQKTAIFANLRTLEPKNPLKSILGSWEPKNTIPEL